MNFEYYGARTSHMLQNFINKYSESRFTGRALYKLGTLYFKEAKSRLIRKRKQFISAEDLIFGSSNEPIPIYKMDEVINSYVNFLNNYESNAPSKSQLVFERVQSAKKRIEKFYFEIASKSQDMASYNHFLKLYPTGEYASQIQEKIKSKKTEIEKRAFTKVIKSKIIWDDENFLETYPNSKYRPEIEAKLRSAKIFVAKKTLVISYSSLKRKYHWDGNKRIWNCGAGINVKITHPARTYSGQPCVGILQFEGSIKAVDNGIELFKGTKMVYP